MDPDATVPARPLRVLVAGATGYIGRRLVGDLVAAGHEVRCVARTPRKLDGELWRDRVEVVQGDVLDPSTLPAACAEVDAVYYLVHSIGADADWEERDRRAIANRTRDAQREMSESMCRGRTMFWSSSPSAAHLCPATRSLGL